MDIRILNKCDFTLDKLLKCEYNVFNSHKMKAGERIMEKLKELREKENLTQIQLAEKTGISSSSIGMYEIKARNPTTGKSKILADFFGVSIDYLVYGDTHKSLKKRG
jgi:DNA-binding XRE family transcriptional regulator